MVRAGLLHTIQQRLAGDELAPSTAGGKRQGGMPGTGQRHVPLLLRAKEPAVEERLLKVAAGKGADGAGDAAAAAAEAVARAGNGGGPSEQAGQPGNGQPACVQ